MILTHDWNLCFLYSVHQCFSIQSSGIPRWSMFCSLPNPHQVVQVRCNRMQLLTFCLLCLDFFLFSVCLFLSSPSPSLSSSELLLPGWRAGLLIGRLGGCRLIPASAVQSEYSLESSLWNKTHVTFPVSWGDEFIQCTVGGEGADLELLSLCHCASPSEEGSLTSTCSSSCSQERHHIVEDNTMSTALKSTPQSKVDKRNVLQVLQLGKILPCRSLIRDQCFWGTQRVNSQSGTQPEAGGTLCSPSEAWVH